MNCGGDGTDDAGTTITLGAILSPIHTCSKDIPPFVLPENAY